MTTYATIKAKIASDIGRSNLGSDISLAVQEAIRFYSIRRFRWNIFLDQTFSISTGLEWYTSTQFSLLSDITKFDVVKLYRSATDRRVLDPENHDQMEKLVTSNSQTGIPNRYEFYAEQLRFYPLPNGTYPIVVSGLRRLTALSADADTNAWMIAGEPLIRACSKKLLYRDVIQDMEESQKCEIAEARAFDALKIEITGLETSNRIIPTDF